MNSGAKTVISGVLFVILVIATAFLARVAILWADAGSQMGEIVVKEAAVTLSGVRKEYLVGQEIDKKGVSLEINGEKTEDVKVTCDTSSAGKKRVEVSCEKNGIYYQGFYTVTVFSVRHIDFRSNPTNVYQDENGQWHADGLVVWADLNAAATEFEKPSTFDSVIKLPDDYFNLSVQMDSEVAGAYTLDVSFASYKLSYYFIKAGGQTMMLSSKDRILNFTNVNGGAETLTLYVTQIESSGDDGENGAEGYYVFKAANGTETLRRFKFYLNGYASNFVSSTFGEGMTDAYDGNDEGYNATYSGVTFHAEKAAWHKAILNWND